MYRWFYCRISTKKQSLTKQVEAAKDYAHNHESKDITDKYVKEVYSGAKQRPKFQSMLKQLRSGDEIIVVRLDRFSRSLRIALNAIHDIKQHHCTMKVLTPFPMDILKKNKQGKITNPNETKVDMLLLFAQWERKAITHRTHLAIKVNSHHNKNFKVGRKSRADSKWINYYINIYEYTKNHTITATAKHFHNIERGSHYGKHISRQEVYKIIHLFNDNNKAHKLLLKHDKALNG